MADLVPSEDIEAIVGTYRRRTKHVGRADSATETVYILHAQECLDAGGDLRGCPYSLALDRGIHLSTWRHHQDAARFLYISYGQLWPLDFPKPGPLSKPLLWDGDQA